MKNLLSAAVLCASLAATSLVAHATTISASDSESFHGVKIDGQSTGDFDGGLTTISWSRITPGDGTGAFLGLVTDADGVNQGGSNILYVNSSNGGTTGNPFTFIVKGDDGSVLGTFTETAAPFVVSHGSTSNSSNLTLELYGTFVYSGSLAGLGTQDADFNVAFGQTGNSLSGSGTFATPSTFTPPPTVPEPSSLALLGTGLLGGLGVVRRRFNK